MYDSVMRVILSANGSVNIAFLDWHTISCTPHILMSFLMEPFTFCETIYPKLDKNTRYINPSDSELNEIPGITLVYINRDRSIVIIYSEILRRLFFAIQQRHIDSPRCSAHIFTLHFFGFLDTSSENISGGGGEISVIVAAKAALAGLIAFVSVSPGQLL